MQEVGLHDAHAHNMAAAASPLKGFVRSLYVKNSVFSAFSCFQIV